MTGKPRGERTRSLRWRLSLTYAGMSLFTALVLGGFLYLMMDVHFARTDADRLRGVARSTARDVAAAGQVPVVDVLRLAAYANNARVQAFDAQHRLIADSGSPEKITDLPPSVQAPGAANVIPPPRADEPRSGSSHEQAVSPVSPAGVAFIRASEVPSSAGTLMRTVTVAWAVAAAAAVLAGALVGYGVSVRISRPLVKLAEASDRMASGDLGVRAEVAGDDEVARLGRSFNAMAAQVESTIAALRRFVSDAAHELGTPLTALRTDLEMLREGGSADDAQRLADRALTQEQRLEGLGRGLLQLSRLESFDTHAVREPVEVASLVRAVADAFSSRAEQGGITLGLSLPERSPVVAADPAQVRVAVENLIDNAVKFTPDGGTVTVAVEERAGDAVVRVADDGPGIPAADRGRVFERFYRARDTAAVPGSGLGLAIVRAAAGACGGTARLVPTEVGTTIEVALPLAAGPSRPMR